MFKKQQILQQNTNCHSKKWNNLAKKPVFLFFFGIVTTSCWLRPWFNFKPYSHIVVIVSEKKSISSKIGIISLIGIESLFKILDPCPIKTILNLSILL